MTPTECVNLCRLLSARCPAMKMDEATPDAWYLDLRDVEQADAMEAVVRLTRRQSFVALSDLIGECGRVRRERLGRERRVALEEQIAAENAENPGEIHDRPVSALTVGRVVPFDDAARVERRAMLRAAAHARRERVEQDTAAANERRERLEQARRELDAIRKPEGAA